MSYCWGDPTANRVILLNGKRHKVPESVHDLLNSLLSKSIGWIWIDAICINQNDNDEKSWQIGAMGRIYSNARRWIAVAQLFQRPWFYRMWTIQEAVLSTDKLLFHCGKLEILFSDIWDVFYQLQVAGIMGLLLPEVQDPFDARIAPKAFPQIRLIVALRYYITDHSTDDDFFGLEEAILYCSGALATNPRDHIYGVYGIVADATDEELKANYGAPVEDIYVKTTRYLISRNKSLRLLSDSDIYPSSRLDVPSWVPNYNTPRESPRLGFGFYTASGTRPPETRWDTTTNRLTTSGIILDDVFSISSQKLSLTAKITTDDIRVWYEAAQLLLSTWNSSAEHDTQISTEALWTTLMTGRFLNEDVEYEKVGPDYGVAFNAFHHYITRLDDFEELSLHEWDTEDPIMKPLMEIFKKALEFYTVAVESWVGRKLVATKKGRLALVPHATEISDQIGILLGARTPFVLRQGENGRHIDDV
ncbi:hypothetical protein IFR05_013872 [Cadophora sp. M221]|nr:hypothetical protein IFR05_013872 [Cadophora sp. M221]